MAAYSSSVPTEMPLIKCTKVSEACQRKRLPENLQAETLSPAIANAVLVAVYYCIIFSAISSTSFNFSTAFLNIEIAAELSIFVFQFERSEYSNCGLSNLVISTVLNFGRLNDN